MRGAEADERVLPAATVCPHPVRGLRWTVRKAGQCVSPAASSEGVNEAVRADRRARRWQDLDPAASAAARLLRRRRGRDRCDQQRAETGHGRAVARRRLHRQDRRTSAPQAAGTGARRRPGADIDRSPLCTLALARYLRHPVTTMLAHEVARIMRGQVYERVVFLIRPIGFIEPSAARRISYADSLAFERLHEVVYRDHGFYIIDVAAAGVTGRAAAIADIIESLS